MSIFSHDGESEPTITATRLKNDGEHEYEEVVIDGGNSYAIMPDRIKRMSLEERDTIAKEVVRKIDFIILPIIVLLYILNYIDRQNVSAAKVQGIMEDLSLRADQFSTVISILYVGYIPFQVPSNMIMTSITRPGLYICVAVTVWGTISACTAAVQSYAALLAVCVILGAVEAVFFPGVIYFLSAWYTKEELGKRLAVLYIGQQLGSAFGGLSAAGVLHLDGIHGIAGWRYLFIVEGSATVGIGVICCFLMPEYPHNARILSQTERDIAVWRIEQEAGAAEAHGHMSAVKGLLLAVADFKVWALVLCVIMSQAMNSALNYLPTIVATLGYDETTTLALTAPPYLFACFYFYFISWWSDKRMSLYWPLMSCLFMGMIAFIISLSTTELGAAYFAMMFFPSAAIGPQIMLYKTVNLHLARPYPKRAAAIALLNAIGGTSNIWGSYLWTDGPRFFAGFAMCLGVVIAFALIITWYKVHVLRENKHLEGDEVEVQRAMKGGVTTEQVSMGWRYEGY